MAKKLKITASDKNPVMLLNELKPALKYECEECGDSPATKRFVMTVTVDDRTFEGSGASKKLAKQACARMALTALYNMSFTPGLLAADNAGGSSGDEKSADEKDQLVPGTRIRLEKNEPGFLANVGYSRNLPGQSGFFCHY